MKVELKKVKCLRCSYEWLPRTSDIRQCAKCRSPWWDRPVERVGVSDKAKEINTKPITDGQNIIT